MADPDAAKTRRSFEATGVVRLDGAFTAEAAAAMRAAVWEYVEREAGVRTDDPTPGRRAGPGSTGKGLRGSPVFERLTGNAVVRRALDAIFGAGGWRPPKPGAQILVTFPQRGPWVLPTAWHMDCGFAQPTWPVFAVKLFAFVGEVGPEGGGTMMLPGSHLLVERYRRTIPPGTGGGKENWHAFLKHHQGLANLLEGAASRDGGCSLVGQRRVVDEVPVEVVELTGRPGVVVLAHLHVFHSAAPNVTRQPRLMLGKAIQATTDPVDHD